MNDRIQEAIDFIKTKYAPAKDFTDADILLTSHDIIEEIKMHFQKWDLSTEDFIQKFKRSGFIYDTLPESVRFVWLLKAK